ncbi:MAG: hypothetical protein J0I07_35515 [Myxococcales bacterium]|nr:hypothetical protein [Myxococcales bacterium]
MKDAADAILRPEQAAYLDGIEPTRDPLLVEMEAYAKANRQPISDPEVASFLAVTARLSGARKIVEVGTNIGYGAIVLARSSMTPRRPPWREASSSAPVCPRRSRSARPTRSQRSRC